MSIIDIIYRKNKTRIMQWSFGFL